MQAVILAAGKSTRTYPLTLAKPKPLLKVANKTILEWNLEAIKDIAEEIILVVGYKKDMIKEFIQKNYPELNIKFVEQKEQLGTGHAVSLLKNHIKNRFILLMGDNIYTRKDVNEVAKYKYAILVKKVKNPELFGVVKEKDNILADIIEKPQKFISDLINCALYSLDKEIFNALKTPKNSKGIFSVPKNSKNFFSTIKRSKRGEYELTDALKYLSKKENIHCIKSPFCLLITHPKDLLLAERELRKNKDIIGKNPKTQKKQIFPVRQKK